MVNTLRERLHTVKFMKKTIIFLMLCTFICTLSFSCKKKDKNPTSSPMKGTLTFDCPDYLLKGSTLKLTVKGIETPKEEEITYTWTVSWDKKKEVTGKTFKPVFPNKLDRYTITCTAKAKGYNNSSKTGSIILIDDNLNGTLKNTGIKETNEKFKDTRDNTEYYLFTVAGKTWMQQNFAYKNSGKNEAEPLRKIYGNYYTYEEAIKACPSGWHLPTNEEWAQLANTTGGPFDSTKPFDGIAGAFMCPATFNGERTWVFWPKVNKTNVLGFSAIPSGYAVISDGKYSFKEKNETAAFWTADKVDEDTAYFRYINSNETKVYIGKGDTKSFAASVRYIRN